MTNQYKIQLHKFLYEFLTDNKKAAFKKVLPYRTRHITVVLEDIFQSHNASAVLRSADIFGIQDIHIIENKNVYSVDRDVSMGSTKWLDLHHYNQNEENTIDCIDHLKSLNYKIVATTPNVNDFHIDQLPLNDKVALFFGTELNGLSEVVLQNADYFAKIPMYGFTESFNISVAAAIALFSLTQKLHKSEINWQLSADELFDLESRWTMASLKKPELLIQRFEEFLESQKE